MSHSCNAASVTDGGNRRLETFNAVRDRGAASIRTATRKRSLPAAPSFGESPCRGRLSGSDRKARRSRAVDVDLVALATRFPRCGAP